MKSKTVLVLGITVCVLGIVAYLSLKTDTASQPGRAMGETLLADLPLEKVATLRLQGPETEVTLNYTDKRWELSQRNGYPADFSKIRDFVEKLSQVQIGRVFEAGPETRARLSLKAPDAQEGSPEASGTRVVLADKSGEPLAELLMGSVRQTDAGSGGHYLIKGDGDQVMLVDQSFHSLDTDPKAWLDKDLIDLAFSDVRSVVCENTETGQTVYTLEREEKGKKARLLEPPPGKKVLQHKIDSVLRAAASFQLADVAEKAAAPTDDQFTHCLRFSDFDGRSYRLCPGPKKADAQEERYYLKLSASYNPPAEPAAKKPSESDPPAEATDKADAASAGESDAGELADKADAGDGDGDGGQTDKNAAKQAEKAQEGVQQEMETQNKRFGDWVYLISKWKHESLITDKSAFVEEPEPPDSGEPQAESEATP